MTIKIDLAWVFPGLLLLVIGVIMLIVCGIAFLIWIFATFDFSGIFLLTMLGLLLLASGLAMIFRGAPFWTFMHG